MIAPRRGYSLIEMLAVIACLTVLLGVGVASLQGLVRVERASRASRDEDRTIDRLAQTFRADVHRATERGVANDALLLRLRSNNTVEYRVEGTSVIVTRQQGDQPPHVERFRLRAQGTPRLDWVDHNGRAFARLVLPRQDSGVGLRIEAALGLGLRADEEEQP